MPHDNGYCALKACKRLVALVSPSFNQISVQRAASSTASSISFCSLAGGLPSTKPTTLFCRPDGRFRRVNGESSGAELTDDILQAIVAAMATAKLKFRHARR